MGRKPLVQPDQALTAIRRWIAEHGMPPTIEELRQELGVGSPRTVYRVLAELEKRGDIERWPGARGIRLLKALESTVETIAVPIAGVAPAGPLMLAEQNIEGWVRVPKDRARAGKYFLLRVAGDSMNRARARDGQSIEDGDLVLVRQQATADPGDIVVALVDGEATIKRFEAGPGYVVLRAQSSKHYDPIVVDEAFNIQGVVWGVLKKGSMVI